MSGFFPWLLAASIAALPSSPQATLRLPPDRTPVVVPNIDGDAACMIALTIGFLNFVGRSEPDKVKSALTGQDFEGSLNFYSGSLSRQYQDAGLSAAMRSARIAVVALPSVDKERLVTQCVATKALRVIAVRQAIVS